jgi:hypothetical protein
MNYIYCRLPTNSRGSLAQIARRFAHTKSMHLWVNRLLQKDDPRTEILCKIFNKNFIRQPVAMGIKILSTLRCDPIDESEQSLFTGTFDWTDRLEYKTVLYHSLAYKRCGESVSYIAHVNHPTCDFVRIKRFIHKDEKYLIVALPYKTIQKITEDVQEPRNEGLKSLLRRQAYGNFCVQVEETDTVVTMPIEVIQNLCIRISVHDVIYLTPLCHKYEHD